MKMMKKTMNEDRKTHRWNRWLLSLLLAAPLAGLAGAAPPGEDEPTIEPAPETKGSPFLLKQTDARAVVSGPVAHVVVTQKWENPNTVPVDGLYIFPLPENAAVTDMKLRIGERTIHSDMKRREEARAIYEQARREGRVAGLLDQERPNIFAQRVANIMPGMAIDVILAFDHPIECEDGRCEYVFPTVVGPRFIPAHQTDPGLIDPPVVEEGSFTGQSLTVAVELDAGVRIRDLGSPSHKVRVRRDGGTRAQVTLAEPEGSRLDRDFRLRWKVGGDRPEVGLLAWRDPLEASEPGVFTLILQPPAAPSDDEAAPRELVFVLDCSGSMSGVPIEASKNVVRKALRAVRPGDTFQIIRFSENASGLGPHPLPATRENIQRALAYLESLRGQGGTHMLAGIQAALARPADPERLRIVAFLTDGYIGNEREIFAAVQRQIGNARLFSFGIGSSVNRYLLEGLAEEGRGVAAFLGPREKPDEMVDRFIKRIETPVLTDIRITWEDLDVEDLEPARIPDLFAGQSLLIHGRYRKPGTGLVTVEGRRMGEVEMLRKVVILSELEEDNEALGRLWARARIHRLERELHGGMRTDVKEAIIALGLRHRLMTHWTSLVAVDKVISNLTGEAQQVTVPVEMPQDVSYEGVFGRDANKKGVRALGGVAGMTLAAPAAAASPGRFVMYEAAPLPTSTGPGGVPGGVLPGSHAGNSGAPGAIPREERDAADESLEPAGQELQEVAFTRVTLHRSDATRVVVQADGEVWRIAPRKRTLIRALSAAEMESLRFALAAAGARGWTSGGTGGARLVVVGPWGSAAIDLPSADPAVSQLVQLLEAWAS
jgi:Ca-activated chloride channel family protein